MTATSTKPGPSPFLVANSRCQMPGLPDRLAGDVTVLARRQSSDALVRLILAAEILYRARRGGHSGHAPLLPYARRDRVMQPGEDFSLTSSPWRRWRRPLGRRGTASTGPLSCSPTGLSRWRCSRRSVSSRCAACSRKEHRPHQKEQWVIPPEASGEFVARLEDVLELYHRPYDGRRPMICLHDAPMQLVGEARVPPAATPAHLGPTHRRVLQPGRARNRQGAPPSWLMSDGQGRRW